ncbi:hypothetical protein ABW19_dt0203757 [Dactylella cylindrospora]|nr:hypothetical protein ABW19_dt0203757 [Dactylella cylindrospora]
MVLLSLDAIAIKPPPLGQKPCAFQLLPPEMHSMILEQMDDFDILCLALTNTYFFAIAKSHLYRFLQKRTAGSWIGKRLTVMGFNSEPERVEPYEIKIHGQPTDFTFPGFKAFDNVDFAGYERRRWKGDRMRTICYGFSPTNDKQKSNILYPKCPDSNEEGAQIFRSRDKIYRSIMDSNEYPLEIKKICYFLVCGRQYDLRKAPLMKRKKGAKRRLPFPKPNDGYVPVSKKYIIRNLSKKEYITYEGAGEVAKLIRKSTSLKWTRYGAVTCSVETAAISTFLMAIMWGGDPVNPPQAWNVQVPPAYFRGVWAGDRFDIVDIEEVETEGWEDVSQDIYQDAIDRIVTFWPRGIRASWAAHSHRIPGLTAASTALPPPAPIIPPAPQFTHPPVVVVPLVPPVPVQASA